MLQYILCESEQYSIAELAQMAIEGGCKWIDLHLPSMTDQAIKAILFPDVIEMCREAGIFLTIDDRPELARELGMHGVRFSRQYFISNPQVTPLQLRDELGPEAIIGIETVDVSSIPSMIAADIDFITIPREFSDDSRIKFIKSVQHINCSIPVVAQGNITAGNVAQYISEGYNGIAVDDSITDSDDPTAAVQSIIDAIMNI